MTSTPEVAAAPSRDGIVEVEAAHGRQRVTVRHSEADADYLWLSLGEAVEVAALLNAAVKPFSEGKPAEGTTP